MDFAVGGTWSAKDVGPPHLYWTATPKIFLPAGRYEVVDSDPATWSTNGELGNRGCVFVYGMAR